MSTRPFALLSERRRASSRVTQAELPSSEALTGPLKFHDLRHLVLASRALVGALVVPRSVRLIA
jgi:hypothetical protein